MRRSSRKSYVAITVVIIAVIAGSMLLFLDNNPRDPAVQDRTFLLPETGNCIIQNGVRYENDSNPYHTMDVYLPEGNGPFPAIIYIHGGGWVEGNRSDFNNTAILYAKRGIAGFSIDYTLAAPNSTAWSENIQDAIDALIFIKENANVYNVDREKIAVMGSSAGAHLASLMGTLTGNEPFLINPTTNEKIHSQICLVINYDGVEDLEFVGQNRTENNDLLYKIVSSQFGGVSYGQNPQLWREASPATYVSADATNFVFVHGIYDRIVPIQVAESFNTKLQSVGVETHFIRIDGDHDILTNDSMALQARYSLDPILKQVFSLK